MWEGGTEMRREIDILVEAARKGCAVVDKNTGVLWTLDELMCCRNAGEYHAVCDLSPPGRQIEISGPYPGCCQIGGASAGTFRYHPVGQTEHFLIFTGPDAAELQPVAAHG
jgi:hypothetical protein